MATNPVKLIHSIAGARIVWLGIGVASLLISLVMASGLATGSGWQSIGNADDNSTAGPIKVVATTAMVAEVVREVGGAAVDVHQLMGQGVDPHLYKATASDVKEVAAAEAVFINGLMLEGRMGEVFLRARERGTTVVALADGVPSDRLLHPADGHGEADPHIWMDPSVWAATIEPVYQALALLRPSAKDQLRANADAYREQVLALDAEVRKVVGAIPPKQRLLITAHDAFGYFGRAYGIQVAGLQGVSTDSESGLADVKRLVDRIVDSRVGAVFTETSVPSKGVQALVEGASARGRTLRIGTPLFSDAMGEPGTSEGTYRGMILHNARAIAEGLGAATGKGDGK